MDKILSPPFLEVALDLYCRRSVRRVSGKTTNISLSTCLTSVYPVGHIFLRLQLPSYYISHCQPQHLTHELMLSTHISRGRVDFNRDSDGRSLAGAEFRTCDLQTPFCFYFRMFLHLVLPPSGSSTAAMQLIRPTSASC